MTVNIEALIYSLEQPYREICDAGIITYRTPPKGTRTDPYLYMDMKKEGIFLTFDNDSTKALRDIALEIKGEK